ncbi:conserved hypothetical protein [Paenibacillus curdlanolyticus YK9]|uniref:Uncharacterized protein n=1 Tax=Paenibacillus curdlanolyticus YK9 TaxID=717606 RepID=E0I713_9BACL|nr:hypothetical protein [Paenibacillus curdlanolyticus]EFM11829.1 conserved hypothetical protein [Paenibacillus curdlanolyticus YK9]
MTVLLLITVVLIYEQVVGGNDGATEQLKQSGEHMGGSIRRMSP